MAPRPVLQCMALAIMMILAVPAAGQTPSQASNYNSLLADYLAVRGSMSPGNRARIESLFRDLRRSYGAGGNVLEPLASRSRAGSLSTNPYLPGSTASPGARYDTRSPGNPYGPYGNRYSPDGARNPYASGGLDIIGSDGTYLGRLNSNRYDPNSVANPYGRYGSPYSPESVNNPYGRFGSPYSPSSAKNPFATSPPSLYTPRAPQPPRMPWSPRPKRR